MAIPVVHTIVLNEIDDPSKSYHWVVRCSCAWEGLAHSRAVADRWAGSHAYAQTLRGNEVIIEVRELLPAPTEAK